MDTLNIYFILLFVHVSWAQVSIVTSPVNLAIANGEDAEFECKVQQTLTSDYLSWSECITKSEPCTRINNDDTMIYVDLGGDPIRGDRYSINVPAGSTGQYDLKITGTVYEEDAGTYVCTAKNADLKGSAQLILLDGELSPTSCTRNTTSLDYAQEGDIIRMVCEQPYRGRWAPVINFDQNGPIIEARTNESSPGIAKYSITITMMPELNGEKYGVRLFFEAPTDTVDNEAVNAPTYWKRFEFNPLNVEYKPRNIDITVEDGCLIAGMRITCNAEGNPNPAYEWRDTNTSEIISTAKVLTVTVEMLGQNTYSCRAYNNLGSVQETVSFQVCTTTTTTTTPIPTTTTTTTVATTSQATTKVPPPSTTDGGSGPGENTGLSTGAIAGIAVGAVVVIAVIIVILVFCCCRKDKEKQKQANESRPNMIRGPDVIRSPEPANNTLPKPALPPPYPDEKVGHDPGPYDPYGRAGPYDVEVPPYDNVDGDDLKNRNVENLTYADLALEDVPRSRKPIQVLDPTEYAEIRRDEDGRLAPVHPSPSAPRANQLVGSGIVPPSPSFRKRAPRNNSTTSSPARSKPPSRNNSTGSFTRELSLPDQSIARSDSTDSSGRGPLLENRPMYPSRPPPPQPHPRSRSPGRSPFAATLNPVAMEELEMRFSNHDNPMYAAMSEV